MNFNGIRNPFYGKKHTKESKIKMRTAHKGKKLSEAHKKNIGLSLKGRPNKGHPAWNKGIKGLHLSPKTEFKKGQNAGNKHPNWKGGRDRRPTGTVEYKKWRTDVFTKDDFTCQHCKQKGGRLHAHHKKFWVEYPELRYVVSNGITLCVSCHRLLHKINTIIKRNKKGQFIKVIRRTS